MFIPSKRTPPQQTEKGNGCYVVKLETSCKPINPLGAVSLSYFALLAFNALGTYGDGGTQAACFVWMASLREPSVSSPQLAHTSSLKF